VVEHSLGKGEVLSSILSSSTSPGPQQKPAVSGRACGFRSTSDQQHDQDDQKYRAQSTTDVRSAIVKTTAAKQEHKDENKNNQTHGADPFENNCYAKNSTRTGRLNALNVV
jgi:hypothetical protein